MIRVLAAVSCILLGAILTSCSAGVTAAQVDEALRRGLAVGDSQAKIEALLSKEKIEFSFDAFQRRYQGIIRDPAPNRPKGYLAIVIHIYVDPESRYLRHEVRNSYTLL